MRRIVAFAALAAASVLGGCSRFDPDDEEPAAGEPAAVEARYEPVVEARDIEIGRTRNGLVITVIGLAPGAGYAAPELRPRRDGRPAPDGYLDFDFVARAPNPALNLGTGSERVRTVRADRHLSLEELRGAIGLRIHAAEGGMLMTF
jgi:hypothetical protein